MQKAHVYKRLFFISKELQLKQWITVNRVVPCTLETSGTNSSLLLKKKNPQGKRREKRKQGARLVEALKSHITQIHNFISGKLQSPQRITKYFFTSQKKKIITISRVVLHIGQYPVKAKTTRKRKNRRMRKKRRKRKGRRRRKRKEGRKRIMEKAGLKSFPSEAHRPLRICSPVQFLQWAGLGNNTTPTRGKLGKNTTPTNSRAEEPSASP